MIAEEKKVLRQRVLKNRALLNESERNSKESIIFEKFKQMGFVNQFASFMVYSSFGSEIQTSQFIDYLFYNDVKVIFPKINNLTKCLDLYQVSDKLHLTKGIWGIMEPDPLQCKAMGIEDIEFILVPGLVFDSYGYRIGYGGGYYDKLLSQEHCDAKKVSIGFDLQYVDKLPTESFDQPIDMLITETKEFIFS